MIPPQFERAADFSEGLAAVRIDGKYGYIDPAGKRIIPPQFDPPFTYEDIRFSEGLAAVYVGGKVGYIDRRGKTVVPSRYTGRAYPYSGGFGLIQAEFDGFGPFHIIDANGELLTEEPIRTDLALFYTVQKSYIDLIFHNLSDVRAIPGVQCHTRSRTIPYADEAWHCVTGDEVFDPCFEQGDNTVYCKSRLYEEEGVLLRLAEALPESRPPVNNGYREMLPALLELANGVRCGVALEKNIILTMEHEEIVTEKSGEFPYVCADGTRAGNQMSFADGKFQFVRNVRLDVTSDGTPTSVSSTIIPIRTIWGAGAEVIAPIPVWVDEP